eukprot:9502514-Pyramimonas_sp.AAC.1
MGPYSGWYSCCPSASCFEWPWACGGRAPRGRRAESRPTGAPSRTESSSDNKARPHCQQTITRKDTLRRHIGVPRCLVLKAPGAQAAQSAARPPDPSGEARGGVHAAGRGGGQETQLGAGRGRRSPTRRRSH